MFISDMLILPLSPVPQELHWEALSLTMATSLIQPVPSSWVLAWITLLMDNVTQYEGDQLHPADLVPWRVTLTF